MASAPPSPLYPNVPQTKGVPPVFRDGRNAASANEKASAAKKDTTLEKNTPPWGLYLANGKLALQCDSVIAMEPSREARIADYQIEGGSFANYNKVMTPGLVRVTVTKGGTASDRQAFLDTLDKLLESTTLFSVVSPDSALLKRNLVRYDFRRTAESGANLIVAELSCQEVRETADIRFSDTKAPSGAETVNAGPVQATKVPPAELPKPAEPSKTPAIKNHAVVSATATTAEKAKAVSTLIAAGATIADLVAKGIQFQSIPLLLTAAQQLTTTIGGQNVRLNIDQKSFGLFVDVFVNGALIIGGVLAEADNPIVRSAYLGFLGDLYFYDIKGSGAGQPNYLELGTRFSLLYAGA